MVAAVTDCPWVTVINGAVVGCVDTDTGGGIFSVGVAGTVQVEVGFPEGAATGDVSLTPPAVVDEIKSTVFASAVVVMQGDTVAGEAMHTGAGDAAEEMSASVVVCDIDAGLLVVTLVFS